MRCERIPGLTTGSITTMNRLVQPVRELFLSNDSKITETFASA
jgi:hypothetical protein